MSSYPTYSDFTILDDAENVQKTISMQIHFFLLSRTLAVIYQSLLSFINVCVDLNVLINEK